MIDLLSSDVTTRCYRKRRRNNNNLHRRMRMNISGRLLMNDDRIVGSHHRRFRLPAVVGILALTIVSVFGLEDPQYDNDLSCDDHDGNGNFRPGFSVQNGGPLPELPRIKLDGTQVELHMVDRCMEFEDNGNTIMRARHRLYEYEDPKNPGTKIVAPYGPVLQIRPGCQFSIKLKNDLGPYDPVNPRGTNGLLDPNGFKLFNTGNLHTHGLHIDPGQVDQECVASAADGQCFPASGDNVFNYADPGGCINYQYKLPENHLPFGTHWYHPHQHGSTAIQTATEHGVIDVKEVETDKELQKLLPAKSKFYSKACLNLRKILLDKTREKIIMLEGMFWRKEPDFNGGLGDDTFPFLAKAAFDAGSEGGVLADPPGPLLRFDHNSETPSNFETTFQDFALLNGAYKPDIILKKGVYHRFRLVNTFIMRWLDISIRKAGSTPTDPGPNYADPTDPHAVCELWLVAKDGVYLPYLPRQLPSITLTAGARADVLVRCNSDPDEQLVFVSGRGPHTPLRNCRAVHCELFGDERTQFNDADGSGNDPRPPELNYNRGELAKIVIEGSDAKGRDTKLLEDACKTDFTPYDYLDKRKFNNKGNTIEQSVIFADQQGSCGLIYKNAAGEVFPTGADPEPPGSYEFVPGADPGLFTFPDPNPIEILKRSVQSWQIGNADEHPYHLHVNHYEVHELPRACMDRADGANKWLQPGDFHDTLQLICECDPRITNDCENLAIGAAKIRFFAADFGGRCPCPKDCPRHDFYDGGATHEQRFWSKLTAGWYDEDKYGHSGWKKDEKCVEQCRATDRITVMHCHYLAHEDEGCMKTMKYTCDGGPGFTGDCADIYAEEGKYDRDISWGRYL